MAETATEERAVEQDASGSEATAAEPAAPTADVPEEAAPGAVGVGPGAAEVARPRRGLEFLGGIELEAVVELGRARLTIGEVMELGPGSVVQLDKMLGDPAEMMIKDRLIARGEVVVVDDKFGLRVTEIVSREPE